MIKSRLHGLMLDVADNNKRPGARVIPWPKTGASNQLWYEDNQSGTIRSKMNNFCLEAQGKLHRTKKNLTTSRGSFIKCIATIQNGLYDKNGHRK